MCTFPIGASGSSSILECNISVGDFEDKSILYTWKNGTTQCSNPPFPSHDFARLIYLLKTDEHKGTISTVCTYKRIYAKCGKISFFLLVNVYK